MYWISPSPSSRSKVNKWKAAEHPLSLSVPGVLRCGWGACVHHVAHGCLHPGWGTTSTLSLQSVVAECSPSCLEGPAWFPLGAPTPFRTSMHIKGTHLVLSSWGAADLKAISERVLVKKMFAGRVGSCAHIFPKGPCPRGDRIFPFFFRISLKNVSSSSWFSHLFLPPIPRWDVFQSHRACVHFPLEAINTDFKP